MAFRPKYGKKSDVHQFAAYGLPASTATKKNYPNVLEVPFRHGDMMVMHGKDIQKFYEVSLLLLSVHGFDVRTGTDVYSTRSNQRE